MNERLTNEPEVGDMLTGRQAAALLPGVSYAMLMRWAREGRVPSTQYVEGGRRLFRRSDIEALLRPRVAPSSGSPAEAAPPGQAMLSWPGAPTPPAPQTPASSVGGER
ncbi:helix-turn-helix domain-containing protein [Actinomyces denticolens]|uniref:helix-turn-helix domain-containing protein n=1 Tax=Actinomyces denticolens TaxID=52767 RepID=UPI0009FB4B0E